MTCRDPGGHWVGDGPGGGMWNIISKTGILCHWELRDSVQCKFLESILCACLRVLQEPSSRWRKGWNRLCGKSDLNVSLQPWARSRPRIPGQIQLGGEKGLIAASSRDWDTFSWREMKFKIEEVSQILRDRLRAGSSEQAPPRTQHKHSRQNLLEPGRGHSAWNVCAWFYRTLNITVCQLPCVWLCLELV